MNKPNETLAPWGPADKANWLKKQSIKRSYKEDVLSQIERLRGKLDVIKYGALSCDPEKYPVFLLKTKNFDPKKKTILITGGVHGYETSGVHGALRFMEREAAKFEKDFNFLCTPCISPWGYETINRWNQLAIDPNRSFIADSPAEECRLFLAAVAPYKESLFAHFDLHETTDTDNTVFRLEKAARDGKTEEFTEIPDGFYTVGDEENPCPAFQKAVIGSVKKVTHIAEPDPQGRIIGAPLQQEGVINYPLKKLSLCAGFSGARFTTTTEVYPDSPRATPDICTEAQVAAVTGGLEYLRNA